MNIIHRVRGIIPVLLLGVLYGGVALIYGALSSEYAVQLLISYLRMPSIILLNVLPVLLLMVLIWLISGRLWVSSALGGLLVGVPCSVAYTKMALRSEPLVAKDLSVVSEAATASETYADLISLPIVLFIVLYIVLVVISVVFFRKKLVWNRQRVVGLVATLVIILVAYFALYSSETVYESTENIEQNEWFMSAWSSADEYACRGLMYPFLYSFQNLREPEPEGYDKDEIETYLAQFDEAVIEEDQQINIMAIMLEAFVDFSVYDLEFVDDPYVNLHQLEEEGMWGTLVTDTFAGGTITTERAFLTGQGVVGDYVNDAQSYVQYFSEQGYKTEGGHPFYGWFYDRELINEYLGFDQYWFYETRYSSPQQESYVGVMKDQEFYEDLLLLYDEATADGSPYFSFSTTYQNHAPFSDTGINDGIYLAQSDGMSESGYYIINNYLDGLAESDAALGYLAAELEAREEPVVLVLFGDHKPWLGNGAYVYDELGLEIDISDEETALNYYATQYLIWANSAARELIGDDFIGEGDLIATNFLMNQVFEVCQFDPPPYMAAINEVMETFSVIKSTGLYWENGVFTTQLSDESMEIVDWYYKLEYYRRNE